MTLLSFHAGGGRGPNHCYREGYGELVKEYENRVIIRCAETGDLVNVHTRNTNAEPTPEEIAEQCAAFREGWPEVRLRRDELYTPAEVMTL